MAPRWTYIDPAIAFNPMMSFQVVIMALLGGAGTLLGPVLGAVPLVLLFEVLTCQLPQRLLDPARRGLHHHRLLPAATASSAWSRRWRPAGHGRRRCRRSRAPDTAVLAVDGLAKSFGGLRAVDGLSFRVEPDEIVGLIGPNGSGKTTVLNMISGALKPDTGSIRFLGRPIAGEQPNRIAVLGVARTFQLVRVLGSMSCRDNVAPALEFRARPATGPRRATSWPTGCSAASASPTRRTLPASELTYIDQKRLELARALALEPKLLLLDEWLAGLNPTELEEGIALIHSLHRRGHRDPHGRARDGCDPLAVRSLHRHERRPPDRRRRAAPRAGRARGRARLSRRARCLRSSGLSVAYGKHRALSDVALTRRARRDRGRARRQRGRQERRC